ncbi:MAG: glycoside hydrolase family 43 protein [Eubacterium sp.]|nr:glycoside hydrolase family 43 protein [Eubacterium sp.]
MDNPTFTNPILPGFYPDPSICRVEDDYYLVTSTFAYFPGVPIFHSRDLIHWEQIGNILDRDEQLPLAGADVSQGIFAPTLRYHDGTFYMITTNVSSALGNFFVTAKDPAGPWSEPYPLGSEGIDPSLFFDDDGTCWYCGTKPRREGARYFGDNEIYIQKLDLETKKLIGDSYPAWHGALRQVEWPEGPHIYKKDGWYYLFISEAGTAHHHAVSVARSKSLTEPFEGCKGNPVLTHRHLGFHYPIVNVGHPDIVQTPNGEWWMVLLASRPYGGYCRNLGRETFLVPFCWEDGWPVINPGRGIVESSGPTPGLPLSITPAVPSREDFDGSRLPLHMMYLRNPVVENYSLTAKKGFLSLRCAKDTICSDGTPSYVCLRQKHFSFRFETSLVFEPAGTDEQAGIVIFQNTAFHYQCLAGTDGSTTVVSVVKTENGSATTVSETVLDAPCHALTLRLEADGQDLSFSFCRKDGSFATIADKLNGRILCTDAAGGFVGNTIGIYATANGNKSDTFAAFDYIEYTGA